LERLQKAWDEAKDGMNFALNFLRSNVGVDSPALLSSSSIAVAISNFGHTLKGSFEGFSHSFERFSSATFSESLGPVRLVSHKHSVVDDDSIHALNA